MHSHELTFPHFPFSASSTKIFCFHSDKNVWTRPQLNKTFPPSQPSSPTEVPITLSSKTNPPQILPLTKMLESVHGIYSSLNCLIITSNFWSVSCFNQKTTKDFVAVLCGTNFAPTMVILWLQEIG